MRSNFSIVALGFCLAVQAPIWAQSSASASDAKSYSSQLRAASEEQVRANSQAAADASSREAYKEQLRRLAGDDSRNGPASRAVSATSPASTASSKEGSVNTEPETKKNAVQPVSLQRGQVRTPQPVLNGAEAQGENSSVGNSSENAISSSACTDPYCERLKQVAEGKELSVANSLIRDNHTLTTERTFIKNLAFDQIHIWESPFQLRDYDATWAVPFGILTGSLIEADRDVSMQLAKPSRRNISDQISNAGLYGSIGVGAGFYGLGLITHDDHKRETGLLSGEAFVNATLVAEALKLAVGRERPFQGDGFGHIGKGASSFPSEHAIGTFAIASMIAREYPNPFVEIGSYGIAAAVAATRVTAGQHFPSDVLVGGTLGYLIGRKIYKDHHNPELDGSEYGTFVHQDKYDAEHSGSAYVPLESWVYPVIDRLAALGFIHSDFDAERPFTRLECARIAAEAEENATYDELDDVREMINSLRAEFAREFEVGGGEGANRSAELESVYTRFTEISGPVLRDGYHFGQTLYNDYGRPYGRGFNDVTGFAARATSGPLVFYFRGEYQRSPANPNYTTEQKSLIEVPDIGAPIRDNQFPAENRFRILDAYLGVNFWGNQLTLGQQSLWWGPGDAGPMMFSNNAEPLPMIRFNRVSPLKLPGILSFLGPIRYDNFLGQITGPYYIFHNPVQSTDLNTILQSGTFVGPNLATDPYVFGQRITFKFRPNFEVGLTRLSTFGGDGFPLTTSSFIRATFSSGNQLAGSVGKQGDRRTGFDLTWNLPKLTFYADEFSEDEVSPLFFPRTSAMHSGIYLPKLPKLRKLDFRAEGVYTDVPGFDALGYFYFNGTWRSGFTDYGNIMGDWIGRDARGFLLTSNWWITAKRSLKFGYREAIADRQFIEGGRYNDYFVKTDFVVTKDVAVSGMLQYEQWRFPALAQGGQSNFTSQLQFTYFPHRNTESSK